MVGQGGRVEFKGGLRSAARRLQADPPQPVAPAAGSNGMVLSQSRGRIGSSGCNCIWLITCVPELRTGILTSP